MSVQENIIKNLERFSHGELKRDYWKNKWGNLNTQTIQDKIKRQKEYLTEEPNYKEYDSRWIFHREYYERSGILAIFFDPLETNGKPPVILGLNGQPIERSFVEAFDVGIYSTYYNYDGSQGAFYKKYIEQYRWVWYNGEMYKVENKERIVEAVDINDINEYIKIIDANLPNDKVAQNFKETLKKIIKSYKNSLKTKNIESLIKKRIEKKIKKIVKKKGKKLIANNETIKSIQRNVLNNPSAKGVIEILKEGKGRARVYNMIIKEKGLIGLSKNSNRKNTNIYHSKKNGKKALVVGEELAPETMGVSMLIGLGVSVTQSLIKNQKTIEKFDGKSTMGVLDMVLLKKYINLITKKELLKVLKKGGFNNLVKGIQKEPEVFKKALNNTNKEWKPK